MSKVSAIQLNSGPNIKVNLYDVKTYVEQISDTDSKMVVLPENFALMGDSEFDRVDVREVYGSGTIQAFMAGAAQKYGVWVVGGDAPIFEVIHLVFRSLLFPPVWSTPQATNGKIAPMTR